MKLIIVVLLIAALLGCAPKLRIEADWESYETIASVPNTLTVNADAGRTWDAVVQVVDEMEMKMIAADSNSGMLTCTRKQTPWENTTLEMNILLQERAPGQTTVYINGVVLATLERDGDWLRVYPSDGEVEQDAFRRLSNRLGVTKPGIAARKVQ